MSDIDVVVLELGHLFVIEVMVSVEYSWILNNLGSFCVINEKHSGVPATRWISVDISESLLDRPLYLFGRTVRQIMVEK